MTYTKAVIFGASGGIGTALAEALPIDDVLRLSRSNGDFDLRDEASIRDAALRCVGADLVIDATGALELEGSAPEKTIQAVDPAVMAAQFAVNAIGPMMILKHVAPKMARNRQTLFASLSARVGSIGDNRLGGWISYRAAKAALNQIIHTSAIELSRRNAQSICVAVHPGTVETPLTRKYVGAHPSVSPDEAAANLLNVMASLTPDQTGGFFDWTGAAVPW